MSGTRTALLLCALVLGQVSTAVAQHGAVEGTIRTQRGAAAGAVVVLVGASQQVYPPPEDPTVIDQVDLRFVPRVVAILPGTTVAFPNSDPILHNVFSPRGPGDGFNLGTYPPGETRSHRFHEPGVHVILCHVHPEMVAYVVVAPTPYRAVVDDAGSFSIPAVPAGRYTLRVWQARRTAYESEVVVASGAATRVQLQLQR